MIPIALGLLVLPLGLLTLLLLLLAQVLFLPLLAYRWLLEPAVSLCLPRMGRILSPLSTFYVNTPLYNHIVVTCHMEPGSSALQLRDRIIERLLQKRPGSAELAHPELRQVTTRLLGHLFWTTAPEFNMDDHVRILQQPFSMEDLGRFQLEFSEAPSPPGRSPWEVLILENVEGGPVLIFKFHHSLADGQAVFSTLMTCVDGSWGPGVPKTGGSLLSRAGACLRGLGTIGLQGARACLPGAGTRDEDWGLTTRVGEELTPFYRLVRPRAVSTGRLKEIRVAQGTSFTAVLVTGIAGGIRAWNGRVGRTPGPRIPCHVYIPNPGRDSRLTNDFRINAMDVHIGPSTPLERLRAAEESLSRVPEQNLLRDICNYNFLHLPYFLQRVPESVPLFPMCLSNFAGPASAATVGGRAIKDMYFFVTCRIYSPLFLQILSYDGTLNLVATGDRRVFKTAESLQYLLECIVAEIEILGALPGADRVSDKKAFLV